MLDVYLGKNMVWDNKMMKKVIYTIICTLLLVLLASPIAILASNISGAQYWAQILVSNNSTATTNVATTANISTENLITGNYLNATANNTVMRNSSGADVPFMPGYTPNNYPWAMWVPSIGANSYLNYILYTAESYGGELCYFPAAGGMTTVDNATLELGNSFAIEQKGWVDTTAGDDKNLVHTEGDVFAVYVSDTTTGNITASIGPRDIVYASPTGFTEGEWTDENKARDSDNTTFAYDSPGAGVWTPYLELTYPLNGVGGAQVKMGNLTGAADLEVDIWDGTDWQNAITQTIPGNGTYSGNIPPVLSAKLRIRLKPVNADAVRVHEVWYQKRAVASISATDIDSADMPVVARNNTLQDVFDSYDTTMMINAAPLWHAQTFTPTESFYIGAVKLRGNKVLNPGDMTISIKNTLSGLPSGGDLVSATILEADLPSVANYISANLTSVVKLTSGTKYAIVWRLSTPNAANYWNSSVHTAGTYTGGNTLLSSNGGTSWNTDYIARDFRFATYTGFEIVINGDSKVGDVVAPSVPDNNDDWAFLQNNVMPYMEYHKISINGILQQHIIWEYGATFSDQSSKGNIATPTFRSASSAPDVSANMTAFLPIAEAKAPDYVLGAAPDFIDADALTGNVTATFTTTPPVGGFPLAGVISAIASATGAPAQLPLLIVAGFIILAASLCMSAIMRKHGSGTLVVKIVAIVAFLGIFIALKNFGIDFWMLVVFLIISIALTMGSRQPGWS